MRLFIVVFFFAFSTHAQEILKKRASENFSIFFNDLKSSFEDDTSSYSLSGFSELTPIYKYPNDLIELTHPEKYENLVAYYDAYFVRKLDSSNAIDFSSINPEIVADYKQLRVLIETAKQTKVHDVDAENKCIKLLKKEMKKYPAPLSGYYQNATILIKTPSAEKTVLFLIEYDDLLNVVNFGKPYVESKK